MSIQRHNDRRLQGFLFPLLTEFPQSSHKNGPHNIKSKEQWKKFFQSSSFFIPMSQNYRIFFLRLYYTILCFFLSSHSFFSEVTLFHYILHMPSSLCDECGPISLISYINTNETDKVSYTLCLSRKTENHKIMFITVHFYSTVQSKSVCIGLGKSSEHFLWMSLKLEDIHITYYFLCLYKMCLCLFLMCSC